MFEAFEYLRTRIGSLIPKQIAAKSIETHTVRNEVADRKRIRDVRII